MNRRERVSHYRPSHGWLPVLPLIVVLVATAEGRSQSSASAVMKGGPLDLGALTASQAVLQSERARQLQERDIALLGSGAVDPDAYVLGPGDLLRLEVRGALSLTAPAVIGADGSITFPQIGTLAVSGLTLTQARAEVADRTRKLLPGAEITLVLDMLRAFKVQVVGEVQRPGAVAATATTRVSEAIQAASGSRDSTSVRRIRVRHTNGTEDAADLLAFLLAGRLDGNPTLRDGDVIILLPRGDLITFAGAVQYPGEYEFVPGDELGALLGVIGIRPDAELDRVIVLRTADDRSYDTLGVAVKPLLSGEASLLLHPGDRVLIRGRGDWRLDALAEVSGAVRFPGAVPVERGRTRVGDVLRAAGGPSDDAVLERVVVLRTASPDTSALEHPVKERNYVAALAGHVQHATVVDLSLGDGPVVEAGDLINVPRHLGWVELAGEVKRPGLYDYHKGWSVADYVNAAGGYGHQAKKSLTRVTRGAAGDVMFASDLDQLAPGDMVWVPEKAPGDLWQSIRDVTALTSTLVTLFLLVRETTR